MKNQHVAILKYNAGNVRSVLLALERHGLTGDWTDDPSTLRQADKVIFPGVGEAASAMRYLRERGLDAVLASLQQPTLGICLGLQLFCRHTEEGDTPGLGIFEETVHKFSGRTGEGIGLKVPHMGWNTLHDLRGPLFKGIGEGSYVYFVHSFYARPGSSQVAGCTYGVPFGAALQHRNFYAVQFHPEKSGPVGHRILHNFLSL
jgi:glutamine amidotransferase